MKRVPRVARVPAFFAEVATKAERVSRAQKEEFNIPSGYTHVVTAVLI